MKEKELKLFAGVFLALLVLFFITGRDIPLLIWMNLSRTY